MSSSQRCPVTSLNNSINLYIICISIDIFRFVVIEFMWAVVINKQFSLSKCFNLCNARDTRIVWRWSNSFTGDIHKPSDISSLNYLVRCITSGYVIVPQIYIICLQLNKVGVMNNVWSDVLQIIIVMFSSFFSDN